jgi:predicted nucleotidyltransferase
MTPEQAELVDKARALLESEARIEAAWLAGSLGQGGGDSWSDVDLLALCGEGQRGDVSAALADATRRQFEPLLLNVLFGGAVLNVVLPEWQRLDISVAEPAELARYEAARLSELINRTGVQPSGHFPEIYEPSAQSLLPVVEEFLRVLGLAPVVLGRGDYVVLISGVDNLRRLTTDLMLEENRIGPWDRGGALKRRSLLTEEQYTQLESLPPLSADPVSAKANNEALAAIFLPRAKRLCADVGVTWPERLEEATRIHLANTLGYAI